LITDLESAILRLAVSVQSCGSSNFWLGRRLAGTGERRRCGVAIGRWGKIVVDVQVREGVGGGRGWRWGGGSVAARRGVEGGFGGERSHYSVVYFIRDCSILSEALKLLSLC
jgi:hypothetical protein